MDLIGELEMLKGRKDFESIKTYLRVMSARYIFYAILQSG